MLRYLIVFVVGLALVLPCAAEEPGVSGLAMLRYCQAAVDIVDGRSEQLTKTQILEAGFCMGWTRGTVALMSTYEGLLGKERLFCPPEGVTNGQAIWIVLRYLQNHPEALHKSGPPLAYRAILEAFPCPAEPAAAARK
jgi:hypothetical protein